MRRLRVLTWHTHGSYLYYLTQAPHEFFVVSKPGRPPGYAGVCGHLPWGANVHDLPASEVVHQCGSGVTACHNLLAMEVAGLPGSKLYPGSWSEWCADPARPIARS